MKHTFNYWIYAKPVGSEVKYELSDIEWSFDTSTPRVLVSAHTVTLELPDIADSTPAIIAILEERKAGMRATASAAIAEVDGQIQSLLAIEHKEVA